MNMQKTFKTLCVALVLSLLSACTGASTGGTNVWLDVPLDGLSFPAVQEIKIEGHANSPTGIARVELWINGALLTTLTDFSVEGDLANFHTAWAPTAPGAYTIQAIAFGADGAASRADSARVSFGDVTATTVVGCPSPVGGGPTPVSCIPEVIGCPSPVGGGPTPVSCVSTVIGCPSPIGGGPTPVSCIPEVVGCPSPVGGGPTPVSCSTVVVTETLTPPPSSAVIKFWADPPEIAAGACTTIHWHVENAGNVIFGGINQPFDGSYEDCLCSSQRYTLRVVHLDGAEETRQVDIAVSGSCETPTSPPPSDTSPPAAPTPAVPADGLSIACKGSQSLAWLPVDDPSGIAEYYVEAQRHSGDNNWQAAPGGSISVGGKTTSIPVECGWYYRWRVRATDGAGNVGNWSGWSQFAITLS